MQRRIFESEHEQFRSTVRGFIEQHVAPNSEKWASAKLVAASAWTEAGKLGIVGFNVPEAYGGADVDDYRYNAVIAEEFWRAGEGAVGMGFSTHSDIVLPYLLRFADDVQKKRWLPRVATGESSLAIAMTEPNAGSDLAGIRTSAVRDGDFYRLNGSKTFITNGQSADFVVVVARTGQHPHRGLTLFMIERGMAGFERGRNLSKIGLHAQDTSELFFSDVKVPLANRIGDEGAGFASMMTNLPQERLFIAVCAVAGSAMLLRTTIDFVKDRQAFGQPLSSFQNTRFTLAEISMQVRAAQAYVDRCITEHNAGTLSAVDAAAAKAFTSELQNTLAARCLQLHGGYGYMTEYPVARAFLDARVQTIYGGTTEIMKEIVARDIGL